MTISPTPISAPSAEGGTFEWSVTYREVGGVGVRLDRDEMTVVDTAGVKAAERRGVWNCSSCQGGLRIQARGVTTVGGQSASLLAAPRSGTFQYTVFYTDDQGNARSTTVTVPVV